MIYAVGYLATIIGCIFLVLGAAQVIADIILSLRSRDAVASKGFAADDVNALAALVSAIGKLPPFALMVLTGVVLLAVGERLAAGLQILSY